MYSARQVSTILWASVNDGNQWAFRHSARNVPLNDSTKALSVGFPGREKATITLTQPDGKHVKTFLIGKMNGNHIVGTFVDDTGTKGEWSAIRAADSPNS